MESDGAVNSFNGQYKFLSNFSWSELEFEGERYPSVEHAFQAAKLRSNAERRAHGFCDPGISFGEAKRLGRRVPLRDDWKEIREDVMARCLEAKFSAPALRAALLRTGAKEIVDGHWGSPDLIWGYHFPSQAGENRLGKLLMGLRSTLQDAPALQSARPTPSTVQAALYILDWPMKCLHDGLPSAYAAKIVELARIHNLSGRLVLLPRRHFCIALRGEGGALDGWESRIRTDNVDVNSRGRPCRERMLVEKLRTSLEDSAGKEDKSFRRMEVESWAALCDALTCAATGLPRARVDAALGPEPPELPQKVHYADNRAAVILDGVRFPLCLNETEAFRTSEAFLGDPEDQSHRGAGEAVLLASVSRGRPSIFGGRFARSIKDVLSTVECQKLVEFTEKLGYGLAGSRGFNPFARYALRCFVDAPALAAVMTRRLSALLPAEYPPDSGRSLVGVNERCRFLKYLPGMHHAGDHTDCAHEDPRGRSFLTVQLYLNETFRGGRTTFISDTLVPVEPTTGGAVVFDHELYHRGGQVTEGVKYAVRLDVLYGYGSVGPSAAVDCEPVAGGLTNGARGGGGRWRKRGS